MNKRLCRIAIVLVLTFLLPVHVSAAEFPALDITAPSAILIEQSTGTVIFEKNAHEKMAPASVTKIMTLLLVMEALDSGKISWDDTVTASEAAAAKGGSQIYLEAGEQMSLTDMLKSVVISSANDCAVALADHIAGSEEAFVALMNQRAAELGMTNTCFVNCTGLDDSDTAKEHQTSSYDIALMSRELLNYEEILPYTTIWMDSVRDGAFGLSNTNKLVRFYPGTTGLKTGFTSAAGYCLSASARREGIQFIAVVMGCETSEQRFSNAKALLDYGFANFSLVSPSPQDPLSPIPVNLGTDDCVQPILADSGSILVEKDMVSSIHCTIQLPDLLEAPVEKHQQLGTMTVHSGDQVLAQIPLLAAESIARLTWKDAAFRLFQRICFG